MKISLRSAAVTAASLTTAACASGPSYDFFRVQSRFVASAQDQAAAEIIQTPAYQGLSKSGLTVAVRAPDRCSNSTTNQATGDAATAGSIIQTNCGVEMGEIERALTKSGYRVISWNILSREMSRNVPAAEVAQSLGAQVLFQINSLENSRKTLGQDARWERSYFHTDMRAAKITPLPLDEGSRAKISTSYLAPIENQQNVRAYAVTIDASAVWVPTGQAIWYYRWTRARAPSDVAAGYTVNLQCVQGYGFEQCNSFTPATPRHKPVGSTVAAGETVGISASERPDDINRAIYAELYRDVVANFVQSFASGQR